MKGLEDILAKTQEFLKQFPVFSTFPLSLLLTGLEKLMENLVFVCPCKDEQNVNLTVAMFFGPPLFIFALIYLVLRPFEYGSSRCAGANDDTQHNCPKAFASCLIPPVMWIFILLLDGDYVACAMTDWKGVSVFDEELKRSWCKPVEDFQNEKELRHLVQTYVLKSQFIAYVGIGTFGALMFILVASLDCCRSGKCDFCPSRLLTSCGREPETQNEGQGSAAMEQEPQVSGSSATTRPQESGSSVTVEQKQQGSGSSAKVEWQPKSSDIVVEGLEESRGSATTGHGPQGTAMLMQELRNLLPHQA